jgi:hypothetical protein
MSEERISLLHREREYLEGLIEVYNASRQFNEHGNKLQSRVFEIERQIERLAAENQLRDANDDGST